MNENNSSNPAVEIWNSVLELLKKELTSTTIDVWFRDVEPVSLTEDQFVICAPNEFKRDILASRYISQLKNALYELFSTDLTVVVVEPNQRENFQSASPNRNILAGSDEFTFTHFVVGPSNRFAYNAAKAVADAPSRSYNPLFLYGNSGLGKTHLMYAIYHSVREQHPDYRIVFVKGEEFTNELNEAIRTRTTENFRAKYRDKDLLLVDDVQFIAGKEATQIEFFNTFNNLYEAGRQIVLTSDRPPSEMNRLEERLRTRFEWGLTADIQPPDEQTRVAIIKNKSLALGLNLPTAVIEYIARNITNNIRQLEGTIRRLLAYQNLMGTNLQEDNDAVMRAVRELIRERDIFTPSPELIIEETARCYDVPISEMTSKSRSRDVVNARQVAMFIIRSETNLSLLEIGKLFDRDHTTVLHSLDKIERQAREDRETMENIRDIKSNVNSKNY